MSCAHELLKQPPIHNLKDVCSSTKFDSQWDAVTVLDGVTCGGTKDAPKMCRSGVCTATFHAVTEAPTAMPTDVPTQPDSPTDAPVPPTHSPTVEAEVNYGSADCRSRLHDSSAVCNGRGTCDASTDSGPEAPHECTCADGWRGSQCQHLACPAVLGV
jgi:hypothetical protein